MSGDLSTRIQLGLEEFATIREHITPLISKTSDSRVGDIETAAACAMLHSFHTEIDKILKLIAREWDERMPSSDVWHKELLKPDGCGHRHATGSDQFRPCGDPREFLAFRHLFRGASIALMRWDKLHPLVSKVDPTYTQTRTELETFQTFLGSRRKAAQ